MNPTEQLAGVDAIPVYREGDSDQASFQIFLSDPVAFPASAEHLADTKVGILAASLLAGLLGAAILSFPSKKT